MPDDATIVEADGVRPKIVVRASFHLSPAPDTQNFSGRLTDQIVTDRSGVRGGAFWSRPDGCVAMAAVALWGISVEAERHHPRPSTRP
jgi:hypothetical protein